MKTQTPKYVKPAELAPPPAEAEGADETDQEESSSAEGELVAHRKVSPVAGEPATEAAPCAPGTAGLPPDWPDARGFQPLGPSPYPVRTKETAEPVLRHTKTYNGNDQDVTTALASYVYFRDEARFGGWQAYLQRSDDFIRFCCHIHIAEMLSARGGAGESRVVWRWPVRR